MTTTAESLAPSNASGQTTRQWDVWTGVLPLVAMAPLLIFEVAALWSRDHLRFFPITLLVVGLLVARRFKTAQGTTHPVRRWAAIALLVIATSIYLFAAWGFSPWLSHLALVFLFAAWALGRFGQVHWGGVMAWTGILATTLPLPWNWDVGLMHWLQGIATWGAAKTLDALAIPCLQNGGLIETRSLTIVSDEICGGVASLYAFFSFAAVLAALNHRSLVVTAKVLLWVPIWTLLANFLRLLTILVVQEYWQRDMSSGWDFRLLELATSLLVLLLIWLSIRFFSMLFDPIPVADAEFGPVFSGINKVFCWPQTDPFEEIEPEDEDERKHFLKLKRQREERIHNWPLFDWVSNPTSLWMVRVSAGLFLLSLILPVRSLASQGFSSLNFGVPTLSAITVEQMATADDMPETLDGGWTRAGFNLVQRSARSRLGAYSLEWYYSAGARQLSATLDLPFLGWHDPVAERALRGWKADQVQLHWQDNWPWCEAELENELGGKAYVMYSLFTPDAQIYSRVPSHLTGEETVGEEEQNSSTQSETMVTYQFQVFLESGDELTRAELSALREQFLLLRDAAKDLRNPAQ